jgi:hypothetical protein
MKNIRRVISNYMILKPLKTTAFVSNFKEALNKVCVWNDQLLILSLHNFNIKLTWQFFYPFFTFGNKITQQTEWKESPKFALTKKSLLIFIGIDILWPDRWQQAGRSHKMVAFYRLYYKTWHSWHWSSWCIPGSKLSPFKYSNTYIG